MEKRLVAKYSTKEEIEKLLELTRDETENMASEKQKKQKKQLTKRQKIIRGIANVFYFALVGVLVILLYLGVQSRSNGKLPSLFGFYVFNVQTGSMVPTLPIGCYILSRTPADPSAVEPDTIVSFYLKEGVIVTHRIIARNVDEDGSVTYLTKGDNSANGIDPTVLTPESIIAVYVLKITLPKVWSMN